MWGGGGGEGGRGEDHDNFTLRRYDAYLAKYEIVIYLKIANRSEGNRFTTIIYLK